MLCKNVFCIYWEEDNCILGETSLDIQGNCENCIYVEIEDSRLEVMRKTLLKKIENYE